MVPRVDTCNLESVCFNYLVDVNENGSDFFFYLKRKGAFLVTKTRRII